MEILLTIIALLMLALFRNALVFMYSIKAIRITKENSSRDIEIGGDWMRHWDKYHQYDSHTKMLFDIRKWTFKQFYPDL